MVICSIFEQSHLLNTDVEVAIKHRALWRLTIELWFETRFHLPASFLSNFSLLSMKIQQLIVTVCTSTIINIIYAIMICYFYALRERNKKAVG